ncbi:hypothetical protein CDD82_307 [Ophiocordyceps australis]|uniref:Uncharacterized protein n=1 Tax=Ophiocordyceps australis TaxID=1399860 RepID=A0A2C5YGU6_9HYPO|nr:hypothetical protein CDD82_307 [Ophiocordyceps australis]
MKFNSVLALALASAPLIVATPLYNGAEAAVVEQANSNHVLDTRDPDPGFFGTIGRILKKIPKGSKSAAPKAPSAGSGTGGAAVRGAKDGLKKSTKDAITRTKKPKPGNTLDKFDPAAGDEEQPEEEAGEEEQEPVGSGSDGDVPGVIPLDGDQQAEVEAGEQGAAGSGSDDDVPGVIPLNG